MTMERSSGTRRRVLWTARPGMLVSLLLSLAVTPVVVAQTSAIKIDRISHVDHRLILFDEFDRRFHLADGRYTSLEGVTLVIEGGRIAQQIGCGGKPCALKAHATRIMKDKLSLYVEIEVPDGHYRRSNDEAEAATAEGEEVSFDIVDGKITLLSDPAQEPKPTVGGAPGTANKAEKKAK